MVLNANTEYRKAWNTKQGITEIVFFHSFRICQVSKTTTTGIIRESTYPGDK